MGQRRNRERGTVRLSVFFYNMLDRGACPINPSPLEIEAMDIGHAMQKVAACLADDTDEVHVWKKRR